MDRRRHGHRRQHGNPPGIRGGHHRAVGARHWEIFARLLEASDYLRLISPTFRFHLITADPDDNKFADCAIAAEADYIITEDRHFDALRGSGYKPQPVTPEEFIRLHLSGGGGGAG